MRQRFAIILTIALVFALLFALNAASYVQNERTPDAEWRPDRSTYNSGATGTRALYDFLSEGGYQVVRWGEAPVALINRRDSRISSSVQPSTFVVIGDTRVPFEKAETEELLRWVQAGGRLVIVDRRVDARLLPASGKWRIQTELQQYPTPETAASDKAEDLTRGVDAARPVQPTRLTRDVEEVSQSRFAGLIRISYADKSKEDAAQNQNDAPSNKAANRNTSSHPNAANENDSDVDSSDTPGDTDDFSEDETRLVAPFIKFGEPEPFRVNLFNSAPAATPSIIIRRWDAESEPPPPAAAPPHSDQNAIAPIVHVAGKSGALLVDYPRGAGRIVVLTDPFIIANNGIGRADNLQLALAVLTNGGGRAENNLIAFDEYHQGRGGARNHLLAYFAGTPIIAILAQLALLAAAIAWTRARRFARPVPAARTDRRSSLEFVASMAELQARARAYDLAIENVYARTRRRLARYVGADAARIDNAELAARVAARYSALDRQRLEACLRECEDAMAGAPLNAARALKLAAELRDIERALPVANNNAHV